MENIAGIQVPFTAGRVLSATLSTWFKNFIPFTLLALICFLPDFLYTYFAFHNGLKMSVSTFTIISTALAWLLTMVTTSAITYGAVQELRGRRASLRETIGVGLGRIMGVIGTALLAGLAIGGGFILLIVPGVILSFALFVAVPAAVIENVSGVAALRRSWALTEGHRGSLFGASILIAVVNFAASKVYGTIMEANLKAEFSYGRATAYLLGLVALTAILTPLQSVSSAVAYHDLRRTKEGADIEQLAAVFE